MTGRPDSEHLFPRLREAREALINKALEVHQKYMTLIDTAIAAGDFEVAEKALRFLQEHMPAGADGARMIESSVDKIKAAERGTGPTINIGFKIGGINRPELPAAGAEVIDVKPSE